MISWPNVEQILHTVQWNKIQYQWPSSCPSLGILRYQTVATFSRQFQVSSTYCNIANQSRQKSSPIPPPALRTFSTTLSTICGGDMPSATAPKYMLPAVQGSTKKHRLQLCLAYTSSNRNLRGLRTTWVYPSIFPEDFRTFGCFESGKSYPRIDPFSTVGWFAERDVFMERGGRRR